MTEQEPEALNAETAQQVEDLTRVLFGRTMDLSGPLSGTDDSDIVADSLHDMVADPENTVVDLIEDGKVIGFNIVIPIGKMTAARATESTETAYIYFTGIEPNRQGQGLVKKLNESTFDTLRRKGFRFVELDAMHSSGYDQMVAKSYADAIAARREHDDWGIGPETFFRIDLSKTEPKSRA